MDFFWVVPVIAVAVWILSSLIRPEEPPRRLSARPRRLPDEEERVADEPSGRPSEVDRFLEEIENLRRKAEAKQAEEPSPRPEPLPPVRPRLPVPPPRRVPVEVVAVAAPPVPIGLPSSVPVLKVARPTVEILDVLPVTPAPAAPIVAMPVRRSAPAVAQLHALLQSPQSLRAALLAQAALGPPACRKKR